MGRLRKKKKKSITNPKRRCSHPSSMQAASNCLSYSTLLGKLRSWCQHWWKAISSLWAPPIAGGNVISTAARGGSHLCSADIRSAIPVSLIDDPGWLVFVYSSGQRWGITWSPARHRGNTHTDKQPFKHVFGLWEKARRPRENSHRHDGNMQTKHRKTPSPQGIWTR